METTNGYFKDQFTKQVRPISKHIRNVVLFSAHRSKELMAQVFETWRDEVAVVKRVSAFTQRRNLAICGEIWKRCCDVDLPNMLLITRSVQLVNRPKA